MARLPDIPVDLWRSFQNTIFGEKADDIQSAESFRWGVDDSLNTLPPDDGQDWQAEAKRLEEEQQRRQEEQRKQIEEQARRDQEDYQRIEEERAVAARANELARNAPQSTYNDPTAGGTISQPLPPQSPAPASFSDTANNLISNTFGPSAPAPAAPPMPEDASQSEQYVQSLSQPNEPVPPPLRNNISHDQQTNTYGPASDAPAEPLSFADTANNLITGAFGPESPNLSPSVVNATTGATHSLISDLTRQAPQPGTERPIQNPDGSITTERSITVTDPDLNDGRATNIPTVWGGQIVSDDEAVDNAIKSGRSWPSFASIDEAEKAAQQRSADLGAGRERSIGGTSLPYDSRESDQGPHELPRPEPSMLERAGSAASSVYNTAVRGGMPDVIDIARKGDEGARYAIDNYGMGKGVKDDARIRELQAEASGGDTSNRGILNPTIDPAWAAANPDKAQELDDLTLGRTMTVGGMAGAGGGGGIARDAIDAIKALRSAGMEEAAVNAERELAMKSPMTLEQIQQQTGAAIKKVTEAVLPKPPLEGPQPGDNIRLPDGTRARVEAPPRGSPSPQTYDEAQQALDAYEDQVVAKHGSYQPILDMLAGKPHGIDPADVQELQRLQNVRDAIGMREDQSALAQAVGNLSDAALNGPAKVEEIHDALRKAQADTNLWTATGSIEGRAYRDAADDLYMRLSHAVGTRERLPQDAIGSLDEAMRVAQDFRRPDSPYGSSPERLINQVRAILDDAVSAGRVTDEAPIGSRPGLPSGRATAPTGPQPGDRVRLPDGTRATVIEGGGGAPPTGRPPAPPSGGPPLPPGGGGAGPLAPTVYQPPRTMAAGGGASLPPPPGGGGRQAPPGMYTTVPPPGPLAATGGGGVGGGMAPGGAPPGGGNAPPVGSLYRNQPSSSRDIPSLGSIARWFVRQNTDRRVDLNDLQKGVSREIGRPLNPDELVSELSRRNTNQAANVRLQEGLRPIFTSMGKDLPYLSEALTYLDNIAVSRALGTPNRTFSWGLTAADSQARLPQLINQMGGIHDPRAQKLNQAIQDVRAFTDAYRKRMLDSGVWSQDLYNDLTTRYPTYIPTRILDYIKNDAAVASGKKLGLSDRGLRSHTLGGTSLEREDPLASIVRLAYDSEKRINQNETFNAFVKLRDASPQLQRQIRQVPTTYTARDGETLVHGFVDGEKRIYAMTHPLAQAVMMDDGQQLPAFARGITNGFRALITHSPVFIAGQVPLDAFSYGVREAGRSKYGPLALPRIATDLVRAYGEAFRGLATGEFKGDAAALLREGGGMAGWQGRSREAAASKVSELSHQNMFEIRNKGDVGRLIKWIATMQPVSAIGERVELAPRIASYRRAGRRMTDQTTNALVQPARGGPPIPVPQRGQRPLSSVERVMAARDVTLDFERGGKLSRVLNQAIPFYNVGWQSSAAVTRAARENPVGFSLSALSIVGGLAVGAEAWNRSDPQLEKDYEDVPDYIKDRGVVIMLPGNAPLDKDGNRRPNYLTIPMRELAPIAILAREAALKVAGKDTRAWDEILGASVSAASPIQATGAADLFSTVNPVGANTVLQLATDKDFFRGQNIDTKFRREEASAASKALSATAQQHGLEWSPAQIEFALRDLGGGASRAGLAASDMLAGKVRDDSRIQNTPLVGDLIRRYVGDATGGVMNRERAQTLKPDLRRQLHAAGVDYVPAPASFEIGKMPLNRSEVGEIQQLTNSYVDEHLRMLVADPSWATATPEERRKGVEYQVARARERAKAVVTNRIDSGEANRRAEQAAQRKAAP